MLGQQDTSLARRLVGAALACSRDWGQDLSSPQPAATRVSVLIVHSRSAEPVWGRAIGRWYVAAPAAV
jgi:hypothetical protein